LAWQPCEFVGDERIINKYDAVCVPETHQEEDQMDSWYIGGDTPSEAQLRREIAYYENKARELARKSPARSGGALSLYEAHAIHRRKLLAALQDGRPESWLEYPGKPLR
jgi:hypothetical protein